MSKIHIIGIGSPFGEDQAGWLAIDLLEQKLNLNTFSSDTRVCSQFAELSQKDLILESRSAAYMRVCEQRIAENQGFMASSVELRTRPICLMKYERPSLHLLSTMQSAEYVYLIDAVVTNKAPRGTLWQFKQDEIMNVDGLISTHGISMAEILELGKTLYNLPENIEFFGIEIGTLNKFTEVSQKILQAIQQLTDKIITQINAILLYA